MASDSKKSNQAAGADRQSCRRAEWLIALHWLQRATIPREWPNFARTTLEVTQYTVVRCAIPAMEDIACTVEDCEFCGRKPVSGINVNKRREIMDREFNLGGGVFRVQILERAGLHWIPANGRDVPPKTLAQWLEEMAQQIRESSDEG